MPPKSFYIKQQDMSSKGKIIVVKGDLLALVDKNLPFTKMNYCQSCSTGKLH